MVVHLTSSRTARLALPTLCLVAALAIFLWRIGAPMAWTDEGVTYVTLQRSWSHLLLLWQGSDAPLLPYYVLAKAWTDTLVAFGLPYSIELIRSFSAVLAAVAAVLVYLLVARHGGRATGLVAAAVFIAMPGVNRYAQEARPYALLMAASALAWWAFDRWNSADDPTATHTGLRRLGWGVVLVVALVLIPFSSLFGLLQWGAIGVACLLCATAWPHRGWFMRRVLLLVPLVVAAALVLVPVLKMAETGAGPSAAKPPTAALLAENVRGVIFNSGEPPAWAVAAILVLVLASLLGARTVASGRFVASLWIWLLVPLIGGIGAALVHPPFIRIRYWMPLALPVAALAGVGAAALWTVLGHLRPRVVGRSLAVVVPAALVAMVAIGGLPAQAAAREPDGHGNRIAPALELVRELQAEHPMAEILIDGSGSLYFLAQPAPDLFDANIISEADPTRTNVWQKVYPREHTRAALEEASSVIWIHYVAQTPRKAFAGLDKDLKKAGLAKTVQETHRGWRVSLWER